MAARRELAKLIRRLKPEIIFAPYHTNTQAARGGIAHVYHYNCGSLVRDAAKFARMSGLDLDVPPHEVKRIYFYMIPANMVPNIGVDVSDVIERIGVLIRCYSSQMAIVFKGIAIEELLRTQRSAFGVSHGVRFAEPFIVDETLFFDPQTLFCV